MNLSELFPRKYASGEDLMGAPLTLTITRVSLETMSSGSFSSNEIKPVVYFSEIKKVSFSTRPSPSRLPRSSAPRKPSNGPEK